MGMERLLTGLAYLVPPLAAVAGMWLLAARRGRGRGSMTGMGVSVRTLTHTRFLDGEPYDGPALARWCQEHNVSFLELPGAWTLKDGRVKTYLRDGDTQRVVRNLRAAGVKVGVWGWPDPANPGGYREAMERAADMTGAQWMKHDPERPYTASGPYTRRQYGDDAGELMRWSTALLPTDVTTYGGGPRYHPSFPWKEFSQGARYGRPQWYDRDSDWSLEHVRKHADSWRRFFPRLCPILSAVDTNTPEQMRAEAQRFLSVANGPAFSYWDFYWLAKSRARSKAAAWNGAHARQLLGGRVVA